MIFIKLMPFESFHNGETIEVALWQSDENICEYSSSIQETGKCDNSGFYYGTSDENEPKFCARHFYQNLVYGDGKVNYKIVG